MTTSTTPPVSPAPRLSAPSPEQAAAATQAEERLMLLMAQGDVSQANAATGLYGDSGTGKTSLVATAAEYNWTRFHKISRYIAADLGGFGNKLLRLIRLGIVQVYNPSNHIEPFATMEDLSRGFWPEKIDNPLTGYAAPDVPLIAPETTRWMVLCPQGHQVTSVRAKLALNGFSRSCPTCKTITTPQNWSSVEEETLRSPGHAQVGLWIYDSATALQDWAMQDMASRAARNMDIGATSDGNALSKTGGRVISGDYAFGTNQPAHYGFAQNRMPGWIKNSRSIPGIVMPPIFTFLELRASDDTGKGSMPIYGPKISGSAKTSDVPAWLGNCLHAAKELNDKGRMEHRLWLVNHIDAGGNAPHLAKTRAEPGSLPAFLADQEGEEPFTRFSLGYFFDRLEQVLHEGSAQDAIDFPDAPLFAKPAVETTEDLVVSKKSLSGKDLERGGARSQARAVVTAVAMSAGAQSAARPAVGTSQGAQGAQGAKPAVAKAVVAKAIATQPTVATVATVAAVASPAASTSPVTAPRPAAVVPRVGGVGVAVVGAAPVPSAAPAKVAAAPNVPSTGATPTVTAPPVAHSVTSASTAAPTPSVRPTVTAIRPAGRPPAPPPPGPAPKKSGGGGRNVDAGKVNLGPITTNAGNPTNTFHQESRYPNGRRTQSQRGSGGGHIHRG